MDNRFHREYVVEDDTYESGSMSVEQMKKVMRGLMDAQMDIIRFSMNRPWPQEVEKEGSD
jgi:hypothetical protein